MNKTRLPEIVIGQSEHASLTSLATEAEDRLPGVAEALLNELDRARIVGEGKVPANVVRMGSTVEYRSDDGQQRRVTLVYPAKADIAEGRISVMTPIGAALIGLKEGQSIGWLARDGREQSLRVLNVEPPATGNVTPLRPRTATPDDDPGPYAA